MKRTDWKYLVDTFLFICVVGIALIGLLMALVLPKGPGVQESAKYFLSLHRHQWGNIHFYLSLAFVVLVIIHLILSWSWIEGKARQLFKQSWAAMLILTVIVSLVVLFVFWTFYPRVPGAYEDYGVRAGRQAKAETFREDPSSIPIQGQMTLRDVEKATGVPAGKVAEAMGLPAGVSLDETLGQLRKKFSFVLQDVRDAVADLREKSESPVEKEVAAENKEILDTKVIEEKVPGGPTGQLHGEHEEEVGKKLTRGSRPEDRSGVLIHGQMTLYDLEKVTGIPARRIAEELRLPAGAPLDEYLGRLRKRYSFTMQEVRDVVSSLMKKNDQGSDNDQ